jgi:hypothetical protein
MLPLTKQYRDFPPTGDRLSQYVDKLQFAIVFEKSQPAAVEKTAAPRCDTDRRGECT